VCTDEIDVRGICVALSTLSETLPGVKASKTLSPSKLVIDISKYQGEGGWPTVHNCSRSEHFPIYFGVYSSKKKKLNNLKAFFPFSLRDEVTTSSI
jgi:hypothetical protein